jgi:hexosaminidase
MLLPLVQILLAITPYPLPTNWKHGTVDALLSPSFSIELSSNSSLMKNITTRFTKLLRCKISASARFPPATPPKHHIDTVQVVVVPSPKIDPEALNSRTDESYTLSISETKRSDASDAVVRIEARSVFGARHGLETLAQMVETPTGLVQNAIGLQIADNATYPYRAIMIDTGRHFLSVRTIKHVLDGMAMLKLNVLHWHLVDSQSFPVQSRKFPQLSAKGAYAPAAVYTLVDLASVVAYARERGVRVVAEFDMPGHGAFSAGMPELSLSSCSDVFDVTRPELYSFLADFLGEMSTVFTDELLMLGGDEVGFDPKCVWPGFEGHPCGYHCFDKDAKVAAWMQAHGLNSTGMNDYFWSQMSSLVFPKLKKTISVWIADTPNPAGGKEQWPAPHMRTLPPGSIANVYQTIGTAKAMMDGGSPVVLSVASSDWYLDYSPTFETVYRVRPCDAAQLDCRSHPEWAARGLLLGGSVSAWGEHLDASNLDPRVFVGAPALAERLWSDLPVTEAGPAAARYQALACHWAFGGVSAYTREKDASEFTAVAKPATAAGVCPADWCESSL